MAGPSSDQAKTLHLHESGDPVKSDVRAELNGTRGVDLDHLSNGSRCSGAALLTVQSETALRTSLQLNFSS